MWLLQTNIIKGGATDEREVLPCSPSIVVVVGHFYRSNGEFLGFRCVSTHGTEQHSPPSTSFCFRPVDGVEEDKSGQCAWGLPFSMAGAGRCRRPLNRKSPRRVTVEGVNQFLRCDRLFCIPFVSFAAFESADKAKRKGAALVTTTRLLTAPLGDHLFALFRKRETFRPHLGSMLFTIRAVPNNHMRLHPQKKTENFVVNFTRRGRCRLNFK